MWTLAAVYDLVKDRGASASRRRWIAVGVVLVAARFLLADLQFGNVNAFVLWLSIAAIVLDYKGRNVLAGLALAGAVSVKVVPAVFLVYFFVRRRYRVAAWTGVWLVALNLAPLVFEPHDLARAWASYFDTGVRGKLTSRLAQPDNQSLWGAFNRAIDLPLARIKFVWAACSIVLAAVAAWVTREVRGKRAGGQAGAASLFFLLGLLVSPGSWVVHYVAVLLPMSYLFAAGVMGPSRPRAYAIVFIAANLIFTVSGWWRSTVRLSIGQSWFVVASGLLFLTLAALVLADRRAEEAPEIAKESGVRRGPPE
jgi:alpha-1,2-mannosyltransferase